MKVHFLEPARQELKEAVDFYERERKGLGIEFARAIRFALNKILRYPEAWAPLSKRTRRCRLRRFPYSVIYRIRPEMIMVVAVMHHSRNLETWQSRLH